MRFGDGKIFWIYVILHRNRNGDRYADKRKRCYHNFRRALPVVRISYVLQISRFHTGSCFFCSFTKKRPPQFCGGSQEIYALSTFPDLRQEVQTYIFLAAPSSVLTLTCLMLDFQILLLLLCEWLTLFPK